MSSAKPRALVSIAYQKAAEAYLASLPLEHFMEATAQATQREITLASLALVRADRSDFHLFNELLVQYRRKRGRVIVQVVPDNMGVLYPEPIEAEGSFDLALQPVGPFWVMEYVSKHTRRKDYEDSFEKYERDLKVPYYLLFYPDNQELTLYRHTGRKYVSVKANANERYAIPEVDVEVALLDGWVRYWYKGKLLPLPAELQRALTAAEWRADAEGQRADAEAQRADAEAQRAATEAQRAAAEAQRAAAEAQRADTEAQRAEKELRRADSEAQRAADLERRLADALRQNEELRAGRPTAEPQQPHSEGPPRPRKGR